MKSWLSKKTIIVLILGLFFTRIGLGTIFSSASDITPENVSNAVNNERSQRNIPILTTNSKLTAAAAYKASDMINRNYFAHVDPDGHYIWDKIIAEGYTPYTILGENLAVDFSDTEGLIAAWIDSPTHRENMLNPSFKDQGMGVNFGNTASGQFSVAIANTFGAQPVTLVPTAPSSIKTTTTPKTSIPKAPTPAPAPTNPKPAPSTPIPVQQTANASAPQPTSNEPQIKLETVKVTPSISGDNLDLHVSFQTTAPVFSASAVVVDKSVALSGTQTNGNNSYSGDVLLDKYFNYQKQDMTLALLDQNNQQISSVQVSMRNDPLPKSQNPMNVLSSIRENIANPDLFNLFRYIIIAFGIIFTLLVSIEFVFKPKQGLEEMAKTSHGPNLFLILIFVSTLLLVRWWN